MTLELETPFIPTPQPSTPFRSLWYVSTEQWLFFSGSASQLRRRLLCRFEMGFQLWCTISNKNKLRVIVMYMLPLECFSIKVNYPGLCLFQRNIAEEFSDIIWL